MFVLFLLVLTRFLYDTSVEVFRRSPSVGSGACKHLAESSRAFGSTRIEPSGKMIVGTLRIPPLIRSTSAAACSSVSILIYSYGMACASNHRFARRQSPHQVVAYIVIVLGMVALGE